MTLSEYVLHCIDEKRQLTGLSDSQGQFLNLFDIAYNRSAQKNFRKIMRTLNSVDLSATILIEIFDIFMKQLKVPQNRENINITSTNHPIRMMATEKALKELKEERENITKDKEE